MKYKIILLIILIVSLTGFGYPLQNQFRLDAVKSPNLDIQVQPIQGPSVNKLLISRTKTSWPWYITRTAGFIAAISLFILIISGVGLISGYTFRFLEPLTAWATHRALGIVFAVSVLIHGVALLFDKYVPFNIAQILFPFLSNYKRVRLFNHNVGSLYVALGILATYALIAMILTTYFWIDKKPHNWKLFHFLAYLVVIFVFFHALYLGTDLMHGVFRTLWIALGIIMALVIIYRFRTVRNK